MDQTAKKKLAALDNPHVLDIVEQYTKLCRPAKVSVITDSDEDIAYVRKRALELGEETALAIEGHTLHFDGPQDQGRDKENTKVLLPDGVHISKRLNAGERTSHLKEVFSLMEGIMEGREMFVRFYCLGPLQSKFSICALQLTDSAYVAHSEDLLYRPGYEEFRKLQDKDMFFHFVHSAGPLDGQVSQDIQRRRIYIDLEGDRVLTINNQYAGNSIGLKKLALRLAIKKSAQEEWLCEHMFIMGVKPEKKDRITYFTGAFPSACGKTSTAMVPGQTIVGDDIAYIRIGEDGHCYAANVEHGVFGIIEDVNPEDDPLIYRALTTPDEVIFSNVLVKDGIPYWLGMGKEAPGQGINFSGAWREGKKDAEGRPIPFAHKNARYTIRLGALDNLDPNLHNPNGVPVQGFIYGGRDSDTNPPVLQALDWEHGVFIGASLESETTAATLGKVGVRKHNPMANLDFLVIPLGTYIANHLAFGRRLKQQPRIFSTNYFLKEHGEYCNSKLDKKVWLLWMEGRVHGEYEAITTPIGYLPKYEDLRALFKQVFDRPYEKKDYEFQFSVRITKHLERLDRIEETFKEEEGVPEAFSKQLQEQRIRLKALQEKSGKSVVRPSELE